VDFHGQSLVAALIDGKPYVAMKPICENIGLQWEAQQKRITRNPVLSKGMSMMDIPSNGGIQQTLCLPLDLLNGWLFGVDVNRVKAEIKPKLIRYQEECYRVLFQHFMPQQAAIDYDRISPAQAQELKELVQAVVNTGKQTHAETWARLHRKFRVNSYLVLPAVRFDEARDYLLGKLPEPQLIPRVDLLNAEALQAAHASALKYFSDYRKAVDEGRRNADIAPIPDEVLTGLLAESLMERRFLLSFDYRFGMTVQPVPKDVMVGGVMQMASAIVHGSIKPSPSELLSMTSACTNILAQRANQQLERCRPDFSGLKPEKSPSPGPAPAPGLLPVQSPHGTHRISRRPLPVFLLLPRGVAHPCACLAPRRRGEVLADADRASGNLDRAGPATAARGT